MIQKDKTYNLATFFCLYIAQTIPMSFFSTVIPVMMRQENFSLSAIGLLRLDHHILRRLRHAGYRDRRVGGTRFQPER